MCSTQSHATIIGGGLSGLSTALMLIHRGYSVRVLEQSTQWGGALSTFVRQGHRFDTGFHYVGGVERELKPILTELGLDTLPWHRLDPNGFDHVWYDGKEYLIGEDTPIDSDDALMHQVLAGNALTMQLSPTLPKQVFNEIEVSFRHGAYRLEGTAKLIVDRLVDEIQQAGGIMETGVHVNDILPYLDEGIVVSSLHPAVTMSLLDEKMVRSVYLRRVSSMPNTWGMFTVHMLIKEGALPPRNYNIFVYPGQPDLWNGGQREGLMITPNNDILQPMDWETLTPYQQDRELYHQFKYKKAEELIDLAKSVIPELRDAIESYWTSSPLTWQRYTLSPQGAAFGILKSTDLPDDGFLSPRTPVEGLYLTGQSLAIHGIKGTLFSVKQTIETICMHL